MKLEHKEYLINIGKLFTGETVDNNKIYFETHDFYKEGIEGRYQAVFTKEVLDGIGKKLLEIAGMDNCL